MPTKETLATAELLIRKPVAEVDANTITQFWLSSASASLALGKTVHWEFKVPGATIDAHVSELDANRRIAIEWSDHTFVTFDFQPIDEGTIVAIRSWGFQGSSADIAAKAIEATQGFTIVLCDLKTLLESGRSMRLVADKAAVIQRRKS